MGRVRVRTDEERSAAVALGRTVKIEVERGEPGRPHAVSSLWVTWEDAYALRDELQALIMEHEMDQAEGRND